MRMFGGIALGGAHWYFSQLEVNSSKSCLIDSRTRDLPETSSLSALLKSIESAMSLKPLLTASEGDRVRLHWSEADASKAAAQLIRRLGIFGSFKELVQDEIEFDGTIGLTHPYGMSPTARRSLPALIGWNAIEQHRVTRNERIATIAPQGGDLADRVCATEAPFATVLELLAQRMLEPGDRIVVFGESFPGVEATGVSIAINEAGTWTVAVDFYGCGTETELVELVTKEFARSVVPNRLTLVPLANVPAIGAIVNAIQARIPVELKPELTGLDLASGAARYAALCAEIPVEVVLNRSDVKSLRFVSIAPYAIGVCGLDDEGNLLWCPLVESGEPFPTEARSLKINGSTAIPSRLILAECLRSGRVREEWETGPENLRWYAELPVHGLQNSQEGCVQISFESSTDAWGYGWSDPFVRGSLVATG